MRESKAELTDRLRREGRWEAFKERREELKASGTPAAQAWFEAATEFPPFSGTVATPAITPDELLALRGKGPTNGMEIAVWVFENIADDSVTPADAPSVGAWGLLQWARSSPSARHEFYRAYAAKIPFDQGMVEDCRERLRWDWRNRAIEAMRTVPSSSAFETSR